MKINFTLLLLCFCSYAFSQTVYNGNTKTGFGGAVGTGSVQITVTGGTTVNFTFTRGTGNFNDLLVIYIDSKTGGFTTTSGFTDVADDHRKAISGFDGGTNRSTVTFPSGFVPDYALAFNNGFGGLWALASGGSHTYVNSANLTPTGSATSATYTASIAKTDIGISGPTIAFGFLGTYISNSGYRSDEAIGDAATGFAPGWNAYNPATYNVYNTALPLSLLSFTAAANSNQVDLKWNTTREENTASFNVEQSTNGSSWNGVALVPAVNAPNGSSYSSRVPAVGKTQYFRLRITDKDGSYRYSNVIILKDGSNTRFDLLNTTAGSLLKVNVSSDPATISTEIYTLNGAKVSANSFTHTGGAATLNISTERLANGMYILSISSGSERQSFRFVKE